MSKTYTFAVLGFAGGHFTRNGSLVFIPAIVRELALNTSVSFRALFPSTFLEGAL
ncbi:MAG: hypothetical protein AAFQ22_00980 [Pseudomonadota bacterium]